MSNDQSRLSEAIAASLAWYADIHALHGVDTTIRDGLWRSRGPALPWHSVVKTLEQDVDAAQVLAAVGDNADCSVADSYGNLALDMYGFDLLVEAQWLWLPSVDSAFSTRAPLGWREIGSADDLATWCAIHDYAGVLTEDALDHPRLAILARYSGAEMLAGAVLNDAGASVGLSNFWSRVGEPSSVAGALAVAAALYPDRPIAAYASGDELAALTGLGFVPLGPHRVWLRRGSTTEGPASTS